jgi:hypothetical protein
VFLDAHNFILFAEKDQIDREQHSDRVHASRRLDPQTGSEARPAASFSQQTYKAEHVAIRKFCIGGDERLSRVVVHVERVPPEGDVLAGHVTAEQAVRSTPSLVRSLLVAVNNDSHEDKCQADCDHSNQSYGFHANSPLCVSIWFLRANQSREAFLAAGPESRIHPLHRADDGAVRAGQITTAMPAIISSRQMRKFLPVHFASAEEASRVQ